MQSGTLSLQDVSTEKGNQSLVKRRSTRHRQPGKVEKKKNEYAFHTKINQTDSRCGCNHAAPDAETTRNQNMKTENSRSYKGRHMHISPHAQCFAFPFPFFYNPRKKQKHNTRMPTRNFPCFAPQKIREGNTGIPVVL